MRRDMPESTVRNRIPEPYNYRYDISDRRCSFAACGLEQAAFASGVGTQWSLLSSTLTGSNPARGTNLQKDIHMGNGWFARLCLLASGLLLISWMIIHNVDILLFCSVCFFMIFLFSLQDVLVKNENK